MKNTKIKVPKVMWGIVRNNNNKLYLSTLWYSKKGSIALFISMSGGIWGDDYCKANFSAVKLDTSKIKLWEEELKVVDSKTGQIAKTRVVREGVGIYTFHADKSELNTTLIVKQGRKKRNSSNK